MECIKDGSVLTPPGFRAGSSSCGLKETAGEPDIALLMGEEELSAAGVFTRNLFAAPPVAWSRSILPSDSLRAIAVCSGNANACTGAQGSRDAAQMAKTVASLAGCRPEQVGVASTGIIGRPLPMTRVEQGLREAFATLSAAGLSARNAEKAIMTTDTRPKSCAVRFECGGVPVSIGAMAKGSGMIAPDMATMLAFVTTDMPAGAHELHDLLKRCVEETFNMITVDGDASTNDSVFLVSSGRAAVRTNAGAKRKFADALFHLMRDLSMQIAADGEGATKLIVVRASGARNRREAVKVAKSIANSLLVKCAVHGEDPNWGRIVCAAGRSGAKFDPGDAGLLLGDVRVLSNGIPTGENACEELKKDEVRIEINLGAGRAAASVWTCDLSKKYVEINADYHT